MVRRLIPDEALFPLLFRRGLAFVVVLLALLLSEAIFAAALVDKTLPRQSLTQTPLVPISSTSKPLAVLSTDVARSNKGKIIANPRKGSFLVATEKLDQSSFSHTVVFLTHYSPRGATGIAVNRSAKIPLEQAFPKQKKLHGIKDILFLGGPVRTDAIFVLMQTKRPHAGMRNITENIYFTIGIEAITHGLPKIEEGEFTRAYVGYTGWASGQLQAEIDRGDWLVIEADPSIIFEMDHSEIWENLYNTWSGRWV